MSAHAAELGTEAVAAFAKAAVQWYPDSAPLHFRYLQFLCMHWRSHRAAPSLLLSHERYIAERQPVAATAVCCEPACGQALTALPPHAGVINYISCPSCKGYTGRTYDSCDEPCYFRVQLTSHRR